ncbi:MAG: O-unit flippase [Romboutsia timonensis]|uniref:lipopolysaccharide biosynthesis protein n=1 Tax=Romboutsia timonensis TaxID=1776391 RepID=UPI002A74AF58|nr:polysaccharide biosynthesis C-terminal domain-containing protein [Romboutsia timonensis]MDY2882891.1 O-unit flippase [Romboutsia timonensis]
MRIKKSLVNSTANIITFVAMIIPTFLLRKVFLLTLGDSWLGVSSLYSNIVGLLSIIELGVGSAIVFSLYKPFANNQREKVKGYLNFYNKFYKRIGTAIFIIGLILMPFLNFLIKDEVNIFQANVGFVLYLLNTYITYLFSYKICVLTVQQEEYKISISLSISKICISLLQIISLYVYPSFIIYMIIQVIIQLIYYLIINMYINSKYKWINEVNGEISQSETQNLYKQMRALFMHKIAGFVVDSTDNIVITAFINLSSVAKYNNYYLIVNSVKSIINRGLSGITASIGNLLVEEDSEKAFIVHKRIFFLNFWITSLSTIILYNVINQFISLWVGDNQIINKFTINIILINFYFTCMRGTVEKFQEGSGNFDQDKYAAILEAVINLISSVILVQYIGLVGVLLGTFLSNFLVIFWTKPLVIYKYVFKRSIKEYFRMYFKYGFIMTIPLIVTNFICNDIKQNISITGFIVNIIINIIVVNIIYFLILRKTNEFLYFKNLATNIFKKNYRKKHLLKI